MNLLDIILFRFSSCMYSVDSASPRLTHMFSVIKFFQSLGTLYGSSEGCIGYKRLGSFALLHHLLEFVYFSQPCTHTLTNTHLLTHTHRIKKFFSVLPAKLVSSFIPGCRCQWNTCGKSPWLGSLCFLQLAGMEMSLFIYFFSLKYQILPFQHINLLDSWSAAVYLFLHF